MVLQKRKHMHLSSSKPSSNPGTMIGQILGGSSPNVAIKYQMMIMVITFTASMLSLMITISLASRKSFDAYGKLLPVMVEKKGKKEHK